MRRVTRPQPRSLVVRPGRYRTRDGRTVRIARYVPRHSSSTYCFRNSKNGCLYFADGKVWMDQEDGGDLIARLPSAKPARVEKGKRKAVEQWEVVSLFKFRTKRAASCIAARWGAAYPGIGTVIRRLTRSSTGRGK